MALSSSRWIAALIALLSPLAGAGAVAHADVSTFGSSLGAPATLNTAANLNYTGTDIPTIANNQPVVVHVNHDGSDTALWNVGVAGASAGAPATGQVTQFRIKGCAQAAAGGPAPLTQVHFQVLHPLGGGAYRVSLTSGAFDLPVCGVGGATPDTISAFPPINMCVAQGDAVAFNDEGGFNASFYPSGVGYQVFAAVPGSSMDSFIRGGGTMNGATFAPGDTTNHDGFASQPGDELLLQATLATGADALPICGGTKGVVVSTALITVAKQTERLSRRGIVPVAVFCHATGLACRGMLTLTVAGVSRSATVDLPSKKTGHLKVHFGKSLKKTFRKRHRTTGSVTVTLDNKSVATQTIRLKG